MPRFSRRHFLQSLGAAAAAASLSSRAWAARAKSRRGVLIGNLKAVDKGSGQDVFALVLIDLDSGAQRTIPLGFFGHGLAFDPRNPHRAVLFEKKGLGACELDLEAGVVLRRLEPLRGRAFYGHGTFSRDGKLLFVTESLLALHQGLFSVLDGTTLEPLGQFPTYGESPHDCMLIDGGKTIVVTNGGGKFPDGDAPCVTFIDVESRKLLEKRTFPNPRINAGHVLVARDRSVAVVSAPRDGLPTTDPGALSLASPKGALTPMTAPAEVTGAMQGETLSLSLHEPSGRLAVTSPAGNQLSFWDMRKQSLVKAVAAPAVRGVAQTLDGAYFVASEGGTGTLSFFSTKTLEQDPRLERKDTGIVGSHLYAWAGAT